MTDVYRGSVSITITISYYILFWSSCQLVFEIYWVKFEFLLSDDTKKNCKNCEIVIVSCPVTQTAEQLPVVMYSRWNLPLSCMFEFFHSGRVMAATDHTKIPNQGVVMLLWRYGNVLVCIVWRGPDRGYIICGKFIETQSSTATNLKQKHAVE